MAVVQPTSSRSVSSSIIALLLLLLIISAGWIIWSRSGSLDPAVVGPLTDVDAIGPAAPRAGRGGPNWRQFAAAIAQNVPDGIQFINGGYIVKAGTARLSIDRRNVPNWRYRFTYAITDLVPPDPSETLRIAMEVLRNPAKAELSGVKKEQIEELKSVGGGGMTAMVVDAADRQQISQLFLAWLDASGGPPSTAPSARSAAATASPSSTANSPAARAAEQKLVSALDALGKRQLEPTRQNETKRAERVQNILGAQLLEKLKQAG